MKPHLNAQGVFERRLAYHRAAIVFLIAVLLYQQLQWGSLVQETGHSTPELLLGTLNYGSVVSQDEQSLGVHEIDYGKDQVKDKPSICFLSVAYASSAIHLDEVPDITNLTDRYTFILYTNLEDYSPEGWIPIVTHLPQRRFITQSRYGKFLAWQNPLIVKLCDVIFFYDLYRVPIDDPGIWNRYAHAILDSRDGLMQVRHFRRVKASESEIEIEMELLNQLRKDLPENLIAFRTWLKNQSDYDGRNTLLWNNGHFGYDPTNVRFQELSKVFWEKYSMEKDSWRDQPLWAYLVHKLKIEAVIMQEDAEEVFLDSGTKGHADHEYTVDADRDGLMWYKTKHEVEVCYPLSAIQRGYMRQVIANYSKSEAAKNSVLELEGKMEPTPMHSTVLQYLAKTVLKPGWSILDAGCSAGMMLKLLDDWYKTESLAHADLVGVDLVPDVTTAAQQFFDKSPIGVFEGDIASLHLPSPHQNKTFDLVMLVDSLEYLDVTRLGCFFQGLKCLTHVGSLVYVHMRTPSVQVAVVNRHTRSGLSYHRLVEGMHHAGFELRAFDYDSVSGCNGKSRMQSSPNPRFQNEVTAVHVVFHRPVNASVFMTQ